MVWKEIPIEKACRHYVSTQRAYNRNALQGKRLCVKLPDFENLRACLNVKVNRNTGNIAFAHGLRIGKRMEIYPTTHQPLICSKEHGRETILKKRMRCKERHQKDKSKEHIKWRQYFSISVEAKAQVIEKITVLDTGEIKIDSYFRRRVYS